MGARGVTPEVAKAAVRRSNTLIAALMLRRATPTRCCAAWSGATTTT
jgi:phosphotransacetylase